MAKLILLLLLGGGLALFAIGNLTPVALVILGIRTPVLPLAVWVLGALLAGALTTVLLSGFSSLSKGAAVRRANQSPREPRSPWTAARSEAKSGSAGAGAAGVGPAGVGRPVDRPVDRPAERASSRDDDWDRDSVAWDNWGESASRPSRPSGPQTEIRDRADEDWANWEDYENRVRSSQGRIPRTEGATNRQADNRANRVDNRTDNRTASRRPDSYRPDQPPDSSARPAESRSREVYDAEYRVLIPPYSTPASNPPITNPPVNIPPGPASSSAPADDEDWGLDDEPQDRPR